jgi:AcrR family transcriptional regulator
MRTINPEGKRHKVLRVARELFVNNGFHNVSIPTIVRASGVSTGAIYSYFPTTEALARHIHDQSLKEFQEKFQARLEGKTNAHDKLRAFADTVFEITERDPALMEYLLFMRHGEFMQGTPPLCLSEPFQRVQEILKDGIAHGEIGTEDVFIGGIAYTGAILRAAQLRLQCVLETPLTEIADRLIAHAWAAIRA